MRFSFRYFSCTYRSVFASNSAISRSSRNSRLLCTTSSAVEAKEDTMLIKMPPIMDAKDGVIERWVKKEGESFAPTDTICEATLGDLTIGIETGTKGILAKIVCAAGSSVKVGETIAVFVENNDQYMNYFEKEMETTKAKAMFNDVKALEVKADAKTVLREIKHMITDGKIEEGSDFAKKLSSLARHGDSEIISAFQASYEGEHFNPETFDVAFFIQNAKDIVAEREEIKKKERSE